MFDSKCTGLGVKRLDSVNRQGECMKEETLRQYQVIR